MLRTRLCELLEIEHPIICAPMAGASGGELAAAVSAAGGLGMIGGSAFEPDELSEEIALVRRQTDRPFGVGFITSAPNVNELMEVALEHRVPVIAHSFADPTPHVRNARQLGLKSVVQVQSVALGIQALDAGADVIAAQGIEAGGHTGYVSGTLPLVTAMIDRAGDTPVVAAGGIADGRGLAAMLVLGAEGVWMGTRFVASVEAMGSDFVKEQVVKHGTDDFILTRVYDIVSQAPFPDDVGERILRNDFTEKWHGRDDEVTERRPEIEAELRRELEGGNQRVVRVLAGNSAGMVHEIEQAGAIVRRIVAEAEKVLSERTQAVLGS